MLLRVVDVEVSVWEVDLVDQCRLMPDQGQALDMSQCSEEGDVLMFGGEERMVLKEVGEEKRGVGV
jgi:hypothetical protein